MHLVGNLDLCNVYKCRKITFLKYIYIYIYINDNKIYLICVKLKIYILYNKIFNSIVYIKKKILDLL